MRYTQLSQPPTAGLGSWATLQGSPNEAQIQQRTPIRADLCNPMVPRVQQPTLSLWTAISSMIPSLAHTRTRLRRSQNLGRQLESQNRLSFQPQTGTRHQMPANPTPTRQDINLRTPPMPSPSSPTHRLACHMAAPGIVNQYPTRTIHNPICIAHRSLIPLIHSLIPTSHRLTPTVLELMSIVPLNTVYHQDPTHFPLDLSTTRQHPRLHRYQDTWRCPTVQYLYLPRLKVKNPACHET